VTRWRWKCNIHLENILCGLVNNNDGDDDDDNNNNNSNLNKLIDTGYWLILWMTYVMLQIIFSYNRVLDTLQTSGGKYGKYEHWGFLLHLHFQFVAAKFGWHDIKDVQVFISIEIMINLNIFNMCLHFLHNKHSQNQANCKQWWIPRALQH